MNLAQIEAMVAVVDYGSFTAAADVLRISQPSLSRRIRSLEADLGTEIFEPVGRSMLLTDTGKGLLGPARRMLREATALEAAASSSRELVRGSLRVAGLPSLVSTVVPGYVGRFHRLHPGIRLEVIGVEDTAELLESVRLARADAAFGEVGRMPDDLAFDSLGDQAFMAVLPGSVSAEPHPRVVDAAVLASHSLVTLPRGTSIRAVADSVYSALGVRPLDVVTTTQRDSLVLLSMHGAGLSIVPEALARQAATLGARIAPFPMPVNRPIGVIYRRGERLAPALTRFLELTAERDGGVPAGE
jgi:DNA-binding transcriptional LysR family regulator